MVSFQNEIQVENQRLVKEKRLLQTAPPFEIPHCLEYEFQLCAKCEPGFLPLGPSCQSARTSFGCQIYNSNEAKCFYCVSDYHKNEEEGICEDVGCKSKSK